RIHSYGLAALPSLEIVENPHQQGHRENSHQQQRDAEFPNSGDIDVGLFEPCAMLIPGHAVEPPPGWDCSPASGAAAPVAAGSTPARGPAIPGERRNPSS